MSAPVETVKRFYDRLEAGDVPGLVEMMTDDIEWETMLDFGLGERGPQPIIDKVLAPLMDEWASFPPEPGEFIRAENNTVVSVGTFMCVHGVTHMTEIHWQPTVLTASRDTDRAEALQRSADAGKEF
jgi:SnoaL-like domain